MTATLAAPSLCDRLAEHTEELRNAVVARLAGPDMPHYQDLEPGLIHKRVAALVSAFVAGSRGNPAPFVEHIRRITSERASEGYYLDEIQRVLSTLEARAWQLAVEDASGDTRELVHDLSIVTGVVGQAKDELARLYLAHSRRAESEVARLQQRLQELFKGTEAHVEP